MFPGFFFLFSYLTAVPRKRKGVETFNIEFLVVSAHVVKIEDHLIEDWSTLKITK